MKQKYFYSFSLLLMAVFCISFSDDTFWCDRPVWNKPIGNISRIAFGSCSKQNKEQPILYEVVSKKPDLFIYLGDNIYGDTKDMRVLKEKYGILSCKPEFKKLINSCKVLATWDDHDFGQDDSGKDYPMKEESKKMFLDFWNDTKNIERQSHTGIYTSYFYGDSAHLVQVILLDLRSFRTGLIGKDGKYQPNFDTTATLMGDTQWTWLKQELKKPAKVRVIGSSTQLCTEHNGWETWANFPLEQKRMFETIKETKANGVVFISGDVHYAELSKQQPEGMYPIYDMTASGITQVENHLAANKYRVGEGLIGRNFGMLEIDWNPTDPILYLKGFNVFGKEKIKGEVKLSTLQF
jgi:alkaline phosphatase D